MDNKVKFEAIKPSRGAFSLSCNSLKNFVLLYPMAVTYIQRCKIYKINSCTGCLGAKELYKQGQWKRSIRHKLYKAIMADKLGEELMVFFLNKFCIIPFKCPIAGQVKEDADCHDLA